MLPKYQMNIFYVTIGVFVFCILFNFFDNISGEDSACNKHAVNLMKKSIRHKTLSDKSKIIENVYKHVNYAIAYLDSAREIATDKLLERSTKVDIQAMVKYLHKKQHNIGKQIR